MSEKKSESKLQRKIIIFLKQKQTSEKLSVKFLQVNSKTNVISKKNSQLQQQKVKVNHLYGSNPHVS